MDAYNTAHGTTFPTTINPVVAAELNNINTAAVPLGTVSASANSDPNVQKFQFGEPNPTTYYFPTVRVDYNMSQNMRFNVAWNMTKQDVRCGKCSHFPGRTF